MGLRMRRRKLLSISTCRSHVRPMLSALAVYGLIQAPNTARKTHSRLCCLLGSLVRVGSRNKGVNSVQKEGNELPGWLKLFSQSRES